jgi:hypothetical protein
MSNDHLEDHELIAMTQQYDQTPDGEYVTHLAYAEINRQGAAGRQWAKCPNCGDPYPLDREGAGDTVCSTKCFDEYLIYVTNESGF